MPNQLTEPLFIQIGRKRYQIASLEQASEMFCAARDASHFGASKVPDADIVTASGKRIARVSYNGRVWPPEPWQPGLRPLYDNRPGERGN